MGTYDAWSRAADKLLWRRWRVHLRDLDQMVAAKAFQSGMAPWAYALQPDLKLGSPEVPDALLPRSQADMGPIDDLVKRVRRHETSLAWLLALGIVFWPLLMLTYVEWAFIRDVRAEIRTRFRRDVDALVAG
jgi:hypothetical protein